MQGGLGNQLFLWFLAEWLTDRGFDARVDVTSIPRFHDGRGILALRLNGLSSQVGIAVPHTFPLVIRRVVHRASSTWWGLHPHVLHAVDGEPLSSSDASPPGRGAVRFEGFFQDDHIVSAALAALPSRAALDIVSPSAWLMSQSLELADGDFCAVHVRRGDFGPAEGRLSYHYYADALEALEVSRRDRVVVWSDEPDLAAACLAPLGLTDVHVLRAPAGSPAGESLALMTRARSVVAANSTFSWWGARLASGKAAIPSQFFPGASEARRKADADLRFPGATVVPSVWEA